MTPVSVLKNNKQAFAWKTTDIPRIFLSFYKHKIQLLDDKKSVVQIQRRLNPNMQEVVKKEIVKLLDTSIIYPIADSPWVSPIQCVPKKGGITVVTNKNDELVPTRTITGWRVCIDYRKLNEATVKDHFPLPFMDQMRMPFGLCNAPATFQRCMLEIFHDMIEESVEVFMDDLSVFGIVLGHKVSSAGLKVDKAKIDRISKLPPPANIKALRHLFKKQDAKPRHIRWILLLQEFDIEIKDRKETENDAIDNLSRIKNDKLSDDSEVDDKFPREIVMEINTKDEPGSQTLQTTWSVILYPKE
uniref:Reverse transcriptase domain-containing protein n=1 Tax=Tanacetum cinerariifolium TaxID=118510 RepID=A0A699IM33_TANCI|nr:reverse transcriptase domain-containing protein [Tanacetum cinerariifolium]